MQSEHFNEFDADDWKKDGSLYGIWTRVAAVKGRCPRPLDEQTTKADSDMKTRKSEIFKQKNLPYKHHVF